MGAALAVSAVIIGALATKALDFVFWSKWLLSYAHLTLFSKKRRLDIYDVHSTDDPYKIGFLTPPIEVDLESPLTEEKLLTSTDEAFFYGVNSDAEFLTVRVSRGVAGESEACLHLKLANGKEYFLKDTRGYQSASCDGRIFSCGDLQLCHLWPMRTWRVFYNGMLCERSKDNSVNEKHVKLALIWRASSDVFDYQSDINIKAVCNGLANSKWSGYAPPVQKLRDILNAYSQSGILCGTVAVEGEENESELYLFGERMRCLGDTTLLKEGEFRHILGRTTKNGRFLHLVDMSIRGVVENLTFGFVVHPTGCTDAASDSKIEIQDGVDGTSQRKKLVTSVNFHDKHFEFEGSQAEEMFKMENRSSWNGSLSSSYLDFRLNDLQGSGLVLEGKVNQTPKRKPPAPRGFIARKAKPRTVDFSDVLCQDSSLTGGKGSSLGKLTELSTNYKNFIVPEGFVVTTSAYEMFLTENVKESIKHLENVLYGVIPGDIKSECEKVVKEVTESDMPSGIRQVIAEAILRTFPDQPGAVKFAVRSSATGEDTEQMSAAGQMDTFLGVTSLDEVIQAVKRCWASQFGFIAVQYKRQNGQLINSPMAVVVQRMVPCDVAGVLFTCDPLSGNPSLLSITANYGLGESVVSGSEEPDTITLKKSSDGNLTIQDKIIGAKSRRIIAKDDGGTREEEVSLDQRESCCLSDEMAIRLGHLAQKIEKSYRSRRDIEWGFWNNNLYIFQSRPVTSGNGETDYEIDHQFDGPMRLEKDYFTVCNVGEVMPGAMSPLGSEILMKYFSLIFQRSEMMNWQDNTKAMYYPTGMTKMCNHLMFYMTDLFEQVGESKEMLQLGNIGMFGRVIEDEELFAVAIERAACHRKKFGKKFKDMKKLFLLFTRVIYFSQRWLKKAQRDLGDYRFAFEKYTTTEELLDSLVSVPFETMDAMSVHMMCSESSSMWNMIIFSILKNAHGKIDENVYTDFAQLVTTDSDVESADVPAAIERLACNISDDIDPKLFKEMSIEEAETWLKTTTLPSRNKYAEFQTRHGHRCLKEFDIHSDPWRTNARTLIKFLQNLVGKDKKELEKKRNKDFHEIISDLKISLGFKAKLFLRIAIPRSRKAVQLRELSKSLLIRCVDSWRKGYSHLGSRMVSEGRIPDSELVYFMTVDELKELIKTRSPRIIARANHRRKRHAVLDPYIFPEIMKGFPKPLNMQDTSLISSDENFSMKGIPVSQGVAKGYIRVALTLEEASHLKAGEILLTFSTDIGWSPYFPILAGVVTELGGLISHGAVVSREYGIPCIAGLHGATRQFQTGDYVLLDGNKGVLQRIPKPEE